MEQQGGGKTGRKQNIDRTQAWQERVNQLMEELKYATTKKEKVAIKRQLKHARKKASEKSENHAQKEQGYR
ncbi:MAG: hypothetical protein AAGD25_02820 [Cyanobacteria bacterium P01_F01_bin.150]